MSHGGPHDYPHAFSPPPRKRPPPLRARIRAAVSVRALVNAAIIVGLAALGAVTLVLSGTKLANAAALVMGT